MARCRSWRFAKAPDDPDRYLPVGKDRKVWKPCRNKVKRGVRRCRECQDALITCPSPAVRRALANEPDQDRYVLEALLSDPDPTVAAVADRVVNGDGIWR